MALGIASSTKEIPLSKNRLSNNSLPREAKVDLETSLGRISSYSLVFKGMNYVFSWASCVSLSEKTAGKLHASQSGVKLYSSTFCIPKFIKKSFSLYDCTKTFGCCLRDKDKGSNFSKKIINASSDLFLCSAQFLNKAGKVAFCLNKTHIIDLTLMADGLPDWLDQMCFVTALPGSVMLIHKLAKSIISYQKAVPTGKESDVVFQTRKNRLAFKVSLNALKVFSLFMVIVSFFSPTFFPSMFVLGVSTCCFAMKLLNSASEENWGGSGASRSFSSHSIHYLAP